MLLSSNILFNPIVKCKGFRSYLSSNFHRCSSFLNQHLSQSTSLTKWPCLNSKIILLFLIWLKVLKVIKSSKWVNQTIEDKRKCLHFHSLVLQLKRRNNLLSLECFHQSTMMELKRSWSHHLNLTTNISRNESVQLSRCDLCLRSKVKIRLTLWFLRRYFIIA